MVVEAEKRLGLGKVVSIVTDREKLKELETKGLPRVIRRASQEDLERVSNNRRLECGALRFCKERIQARGLKMKLIQVRYFFDGTKAIFFFTADRRVDFRELVKDLARKLNTRIEMRQIGVRDEAKIICGIGSCGCQLCCNMFLQDFEPISVRMAKTQNITLDPSKISGRCGRLMCCLHYEQATYVDLQRRLPRCGSTVRTAQGKGLVIRQNILGQAVVLQLESGEVVELGIISFQSPGGRLKEEADEKNRGRDRKPDRGRDDRPRRNKKGRG